MATVVENYLLPNRFLDGGGIVKTVARYSTPNKTLVLRR